MKVGIINMKIVKKGKYLVVVRKTDRDKCGNPRYILNTFEENKSGEYVEALEELKITSYNINEHINYLFNELEGV